MRVLHKRLEMQRMGTRRRRAFRLRTRTKGGVNAPVLKSRTQVHRGQPNWSK